MIYTNLPILYRNYTIFYTNPTFPTISPIVGTVKILFPTQIYLVIFSYTILYIITHCTSINTIYSDILQFTLITKNTYYKLPTLLILCNYKNIFGDTKTSIYISNN